MKGALSAGDAAKVFSKLASLTSSSSEPTIPVSAPPLPPASAAAAEALFAQVQVDGNPLAAFSARLGEVVELEKQVRAELVEFNELERTVLEAVRDKLQLQAELEQPQPGKASDLEVLQNKCRELQNSLKQTEDLFAEELEELKKKTDEFETNSSMRDEGAHVNILKTIENMEKDNAQLEADVTDKKSRLENLKKLTVERAAYQESSNKAKQLQAELAAAIRAQKAHLLEQNEAQVSRLAKLVLDRTKSLAAQQISNAKKLKELTDHRVTIKDSRVLLDKLGEQKVLREQLCADQQERNADLAKKVAAKDVELIHATIGGGGGATNKEALLLSEIAELEKQNAAKALECRELQQLLRARSVTAGGGGSGSGSEGSSSSGSQS